MTVIALLLCAPRFSPLFPLSISFKYFCSLWYRIWKMEIFSTFKSSLKFDKSLQRSNLRKMWLYSQTCDEVWSHGILTIYSTSISPKASVSNNVFKIKYRIVIYQIDMRMGKQSIFFSVIARIFCFIIVFFFSFYSWFLNKTTSLIFKNRNSI